MCSRGPHGPGGCCSGQRARMSHNLCQLLRSGGGRRRLCRETLRCVARTALRTKLREGLADQLTDIVVDGVLTILKPDQPLDLHMVRHRSPGGTAPYCCRLWHLCCAAAARLAPLPRLPLALPCCPWRCGCTANLWSLPVPRIRPTPGIPTHTHHLAAHSSRCRWRSCVCATSWTQTRASYGEAGRGCWQGQAAGCGGRQGWGAGASRATSGSSLAHRMLSPAWRTRHRCVLRRPPSPRPTSPCPVPPRASAPTLLPTLQRFGFGPWLAPPRHAQAPGELPRAQLQRVTGVREERGGLSGGGGGVVVAVVVVCVYGCCCFDDGCMWWCWRGDVRLRCAPTSTPSQPPSQPATATQRHHTCHPTPRPARAPPARPAGQRRVLL